VLCLLLLAMVGWKSLYAIVMLAGCGCFCRSEVQSESRPVALNPGMKSTIVFMI
jgi:hypothetical protein